MYNPFLSLFGMVAGLTDPSEYFRARMRSAEYLESDWEAPAAAEEEPAEEALEEARAAAPGGAEGWTRLVEDVEVPRACASAAAFGGGTVMCPGGMS